MYRHLKLRNWGDTPTPVEDAPEPPKSHSKKDTKKWCRGKVGKEHQLEWIRDTRKDYGRQDLPGWYNLQCKVCGKGFDYCLGSQYYKQGRVRSCKCGNH